MKVAFSIALLATLGLAYSVFFNGGLCDGKKGCGLTPTATTTPVSQCTEGCCSPKSAAVEAAFVSHQDGEKSECSVGKCCSQQSSEVALHQDGECTKCESTCSTGKTCCQENQSDVLVTVATKKQDGEECCEGTCSTGGSCCLEGKDTSTVSLKQDRECSKCTSSCKQDGECSKCPASGALVSTEAKQETCTQGSTCCLAEAMKKLPTMTYKVGTESTCCAEAAAQMAEKSSEAIKYVVAEDEFCCKEMAYTALVEKTESFVNAFVTPAKCEASGQTSLCDKSIACCAAAARQTELVVNATKDIKVGYMVGEKSACCANGAKTLAEKENAPIEYVVNGQKTKCELHARLMAAQAKYAAAIKAIETVGKAVSTESTEKTETKSEVSSNG
jgi:hypothetical protein